MTGRVPPEAIAAQVAVWGDPEQVLDLIDGGAWHPEHFGEYRPVAEAIATIVAAGRVPWPVEVVGQLVATGIAHEDAVRLTDAPGAFEAGACRLDGLRYWTALLATPPPDRRRLRQHLTALCFALERKGGAQFVHDQLEAMAEAMVQ